MARQLILIAGLLSGVAAFAQEPPPYIAQEGVRNAASQIPPSLPGGRLAPGTRIRIDGLRFGTDRNAVSVRVEAAGNSLAAAVISVTPEQVVGVLPEEIPAGKARVVVVRDGVGSQPFEVTIVPASVGLYGRVASGWGQGEIEHAGTGVPNSYAVPARPGERISIAATGLGKLTSPEVFIGGLPARVESAGRGRIVAEIPPKTPAGCHVPVQVRAPGNLVSNTVTVAIGEGKCNEAENWPIRGRAAGSRGAYALMLTQRIHLRVGEGPFFEYRKDEALAMFYEQSTAPLSFVNLLPPVGTCSTFTGLFHPAGSLPSSFADLLKPAWVLRTLDAGERLKVGGAPVEAVDRDKIVTGLYRAVFALNIQGRGDREFLMPGKYELSGDGGKDVGRFAAAVELPGEPKLLNAVTLRAIDRSRPLTVKWRAADSREQVLILITNTDQQTTAMGTCLCVARQGAREMEIPAVALANLPLSRKQAGVPMGYVVVVQIPAGPLAEVNARGIESLRALPARLVGEGIEVR